MQNRYTGDIGDFGKLGQYRTEIVRIFRRHIYSAFAFLCGTSCAAWANAFRLRVGVRLYKFDAGGLSQRFPPKADNAVKENLCTHYALRAKRYVEKYASKMRKHDVCVVAPKVRQGRRTTEGN